MGRRPAANLIEPRGLRLPEAAAYVGVSQTKFLELVDDGRFPKPKKLDSITLWDRRTLDRTLDELFESEPHDPHADVEL